MEVEKKHGNRWRKIYWVMVFLILVSLIFMVRFVLNSSKIYVEKSTVIHPYLIEWSLERDGSLRINEPYYLRTDIKPIKDQLKTPIEDSLIFIHSTQEDRETVSFRSLEPPYLIWKNENSDTIHVLKNNISLKFLMTDD
ncbi:MAG: hypothetical protein PHO74_02195 [Weeksellaceae bacterium]|nr:hypothetical protein [Weeksellaceae bacterium]